MADVTVLGFERFVDGSCRAVVSYRKVVSVVTTMSTGPLPEGQTQEDHETLFLARIQRDADIDAAVDVVDVADYQGQTAVALAAQLRVS